MRVDSFVYFTPFFCSNDDYQRFYALLMCHYKLFMCVCGRQNEKDSNKFSTLRSDYIEHFNRWLKCSTAMFIYADSKPNKFREFMCVWLRTNQMKLLPAIYFDNFIISNMFLVWFSHFHQQTKINRILGSIRSFLSLLSFEDLRPFCCTFAICHKMCESKSRLVVKSNRSHGI